jgi:polyhydroxybutyrate depolymerase
VSIPKRSISRRITIALISATALLALALLLRPSRPDHSADESLVFNGEERYFEVFTPASYDGATPVPLVLVLHGAGGDRALIKSLTGFNTLAEDAGFIVVYPAGRDGTWADGRNPEADVNQPDDVGFIAALLDRLGEEYSVDQARIYVVGASNGAMMAHQLGCALAGRIAAIAAVAAPLPEHTVAGCTPAAALPVLQISGTGDPLVPYAGGQLAWGMVGPGDLLSAEATGQFWAQHNACATTPETSDLPDRDPRDNTRVARLAYPDCAAGADVVLYRVEGGGHSYPGSYQYAPVLLAGHTSMDIDATAVIWAFFEEHPLHLPPNL